MLLGYGVASDSKMSQPRADYRNSMLRLPNLNALILFVRSI